MKVAIVGAAGYIGSYLLGVLRQAGHAVMGYDTRRYDGCVRLRGRDIPAEELRAHDVVVYLAGLSGRAACLCKSYGVVRDENVGDVCELAEKLSQDQLLVYASSASVVEGHVDPVDETCAVHVDRLDTYARSMHDRELALRDLDKNTVGLRLGTVIGVSPSQRRDLLHTAMARSAVNTGAVRVRNAECWRGVLALTELGEAVQAIMARRLSLRGPQVFHVASFNTTIADAAQAVAEAAGAVVEDAGDDPSGLHTGFALDTTAFRGTFGFEFTATNRELAETMVAACERAQTPCRVCKNPGMVVVTDLGCQPLANSYVDRPCRQPCYPLVLTRCPRCFHTQQDTTVPPKALFSTYQYESGTSRTLREYFAWLAEDIISECNGANHTGDAGGTVLELACNDGSQLDEFSKRGWRTFGADPASNIVPIALSKGHDVRCMFWGTDALPEDLPALDAIVAQNVVAHVPDPVAFLRACKQAMGPRTRLYVQTSQCDMYENGEFDTVYHEHLSFFTAASMARAAEEAGLIIVRARKTPIHDTSFLFTMAVGGDGRAHDRSVADMMGRERLLGLYGSQFYVDYKRRIFAIREWTRAAVEQARADGYGIAAFGAAAKGMTLLNLFALDGVEYIVDDAKMKQGLFTPGTNIPILPPARLAEDARPLAILLLAWNFADEISQTIRGLRTESTRLIVPFPTQKITEIKCEP